MARVAAARDSGNELRYEDGALCASPSPDTADDALRGQASLQRKGLSNGGEGYGAKPRVFDVVEAYDGDISGNVHAAGAQSRERPERHVVVGGDESIHLAPAFIKKYPNGVDSGGASEVARCNQRRLEGETARREHPTVGFKTGLSLGVGLGAADEGDPPPPVHVDEVREGGRHARCVVDKEVGESWQGNSQAGQGHTFEPGTERGKALRANVIAHRAGQQHQPVDRSGVGQGVDMVSPFSECGPGTEDATGEADGVHVLLFGDGEDSGQNRVLVHVLQPIDEDSQSGTSRNKS